MKQEEINQVSKELEDILNMMSEKDQSIPMREPMPFEPDPVMEEEDVGDGDFQELDLESLDLNEDLGREEKKPKNRGRLLFSSADGLAAAFWIPIAVMIIIFIQREIFPFGEESFLRTDMYHQYAPFFSEFQYKLRTGGSLLYSWDVGMGVNFSALFAYYLASPLNWLIFFCPKGLIIEFMTYSIVVKIGLAGLSFAYYLKKRFGGGFGIGYFGIFYGLSGYMAAYSWNIMWLDCIILFPIVMLGLERLVKEKKCGLYCISLAACILSNYYISIMICIFMVLYFGALLILENRKKWRDYAVNIIHFSVYSLLAGGLAAGVLLPEICALQATASGEFNFPKTFQSYFSIFDMIARHIGNVQVEIGLDHWPNIYCGVAVLMFFLLYLCCRKISVKEKAVYCGLLLFFYASFSINVLNFIWHGFHYPNSLPCRQSFIYIALMLVVCFRAYENLDSIPWKHGAAAFWGAVAFILLAEEMAGDLTENTEFRFAIFYGAILILALYAGVIYLWKKGRANKNLVVLLALGLVSVEAAVNTTITSVTTTSRTAYTEDNQDVIALVERLSPSAPFYRMEKVKRKTKHDGAWMNFPSVSLFSSTANADLTALFKKLGCEASTNSYSITGSTPLVDSLFSVKYGIYSEEEANNPLLTLTDLEGDTWLYEKAYTLPLGFGVPGDFDTNWQTELGNPVGVQNDLCYMTGASPVLEQIWGEESGSTYTFTTAIDGDYYVYVENKQVDQVQAEAGINAKTFDNVKRGYLLELGYLRAGETVTLTAQEPEGQTINAGVYRFSEKGLEEVYGKLNQSPWNLTEWTDTSLLGTVDMQEAGKLFTSIPYDLGWKVTVDGEPAETEKILDTFLSVNLTAGLHKIQMEYEPVGLRTGGLISAVSLGLFLVFMAAEKQAAYRKKKKLSESEEER